MSSYQVLARKWRPQQFNDMIGQDHVVRALVNALENNRVHHAYLFTGMRGVGKTTVARIFAKCLNCETKGVSAEPCGECATCKDIDAGRFFDLIEVDAASRTKVDETRELLENVPYAPTSGRYKVYLIDEVHMFSNHSFNALLKTLEEPPEHVKFLLATTDPQKVPVTVLSRCLQFNLKRMASNRLAEYLAQILNTESMEHDTSALELIARAADGSVRDALSLVEQAAAFGSGEVRVNDVESMLGRVSTDRLVELLRAIAEGNAASVFEKVEALDEYSPDYMQVMAELLSLLHRVALNHGVQNKGTQDSSVTDNSDELSALCASLSAEETQLYYQIGQHARRDMPFSSDQREAFDMALLRMIAFAPQSDIPIAASTPKVAAVKVVDKPTAARVDTDDKAAVKKKPSAAKAATDNAPPDSDEKDSVSNRPVRSQAARELAAAAVAAAKAPDVPVSTSANIDSNASKSHNRVDSSKIKPAKSAEDKAQTNNGATATPKVTPQNIPLDAFSTETWPDVVAGLAVSGMPRQLISHSVFNTREGDRLNLKLETEQEHLNTDQFRARLQTALSEYTKSDISIAIETVSETLNTPARIDQKNKDDALVAARAAIDDDPMVKQLLSEVDGVVDDDSVQPVGKTD